MRRHTDKEILDKASLYPPPPNTINGNKIKIEVLLDDVIYYITYQKATVAHIPGWEPIEISQ
jgi:hypothetical protein